MKSKLTAAAVIVTSVSLAWAADDVSNNWQSNGGVLSGDYQTVGHWKKGHVPEAGEYADFRLSDPFTVTMPSGT